jgi:hypothetical protein
VLGAARLLPPHENAMIEDLTEDEAWVFLAAILGA